MPAAAASLDHVSLRYGSRCVLDNVSLTVPRDGLTALVGPNGCGKSTIARMLCGFIFPTSGAVHVIGHRLGEVSVHSLRERMKLVQPAMIYEPAARLSVSEVILTGAFGTIDLHDEPAADDLIRRDELVAKLRLTAVAATPFRTCSSGERMRAQIARALLSRPELLILDEPTSGLDLPMREQLLATLDAILQSPDAPAILLVTHHLEEIPPAATHAILMSSGRVAVEGLPRDVFRSSSMTEAFAYPIAVTHAEDGRFYAHARASALE